MRNGRFARVLRAHVGAAIDLLWPPACPRCGGRAEPAREQFCATCWSALRSLAPGEARWEIPAEAGPLPACAAFAVDARFLEILRTSKYRSFRVVGRRLAREAAARVAALLPPGPLVPVPLRADRRRERGFNQTEDFAEALAAVSGRRVETALLVRSRGGPRLAGLPREAREAAVRGAFRPRIAATAEEWVVLVDDVVTTGATARACAAALRAAGAGGVGVAAMGRAFSPREDAAPIDLGEFAQY